MRNDNESTPGRLDAYRWVVTMLDAERKEISSLSAIEIGMLTRAKLVYFERRGAPLPTGKGELHRLVSTFDKAERKALDSVIAKCFRLTPEGWRHDGCDAAMQAADARHCKKVLDGRKGAEKRWEKQRQRDSTAMAQLDHSHWPRSGNEEVNTEKEKTTSSLRTTTTTQASPTGVPEQKHVVSAVPVPNGQGHAGPPDKQEVGPVAAAPEVAAIDTHTSCSTLPEDSPGGKGPDSVEEFLEWVRLRVLAGEVDPAEYCGDLNVPVHTVSPERKRQLDEWMREEVQAQAA